MSYRKLEIWSLARELAIAVHRMTLKELPKFEMFEEGSQLRRAAHSVRSNIVEGYGRRRYKQEFVKHLTYSLGSCDEVNDHLEAVFDTGSLRNKALYNELRAKVEVLGKKLNLFLQSVERQHDRFPLNPKVPEALIQNPESRIQRPVLESSIVNEYASDF